MFKQIFFCENGTRMDVALQMMHDELELEFITNIIHPYDNRVKQFCSEYGADMI